MASAGKTLAAARIKLVYVPRLTDPSKPTVAELEAGVDMSCRVLKEDFNLTAAASETVDGMAQLCDEANTLAYGASNYEGNMTVFRYYDTENLGRHDAQGDIAYQTFKTKGTGGFLVKRETGKKYDVAFEIGDEVEVFEISTDNPQSPSDRDGYIRRTIPLNPQRAWLDAVVA